MEPKPKSRRLMYDPESMINAFEATQRGMSVYKASKMYNIPESTLRDRTRGNVGLDATVGYGKRLFSNSEEQKLVDRIIYMANIGYGYRPSEIKYMAKDYAVSLKKTVKSSSSLSDAWFYALLRRWPDLKVKTAQKLSMARAKQTSKENIDSYFQELNTILTTNNLHAHPERIYNIDETGVSLEHSPAKIVCDRSTTAQVVTSSRSSNVTIIAGANAVGTFIHSYYVFKGKRWNPDLLKGALPGSDGELSSSGWSNTQIFLNYLQNHFVKFANLRVKEPPIKTLLLFDGHKSHVNLTLTKWANGNNVILFVLPPHSSHVTQPLDVGIFAPFKQLYSKECQLYMRQNPGVCINRYNVAELTKNAYLKATSPENVLSAFRKAGVHPFNRQVITPTQVAPSLIYKEPDTLSSNGDSQETIPYGADSDPSDLPIDDACLPDEAATTEATANVFFSFRKITHVERKPKRKFVPPVKSVVGSLHKKSNLDIMKNTKSSN